MTHTGEILAEQQARLMERANAAVQAEADVTEITGVPPVSRLQPTPAKHKNFAQQLLELDLDDEDALGLAQDLDDDEPGEFDESAVEEIAKAKRALLQKYKDHAATLAKGLRQHLEQAREQAEKSREEIRQTVKKHKAEGAKESEAKPDGSQPVAPAGPEAPAQLAEASASNASAPTAEMAAASERTLQKDTRKT